MGINSCPLCSSHGAEDSPELVDHVVRHAYEFALRSLPWPHPPVEDLNKQIGTYVPPKDPERAGRLWTWLEDASCSDIEQNIMLSSFDCADHGIPTDSPISQSYLQEDYFDSHAYFDQMSTAGSQLVAGAEDQTSDLSALSPEYDNSSDYSPKLTSEPHPSHRLDNLFTRSM